MAITKKMTEPYNSDATSSWQVYRKIDIKGDIFKQIFKYSIIPTIVHDME